MHFKTLLQILIVILISTIIAGVYYNYFLKTSSVEKNIEDIIEEKIEDSIEEKIEDSIEENVVNVYKKTINKKNEEKIVKTNKNQIIEKKVNKKVINNLISKESQKDAKDIDNDNKTLEEEKTENVKNNPKDSEELGNILTEVEYLTTDKKGNKYRIFAKSAKTSKENRDILELDVVRGIITSDKRSTIYIVSDFAKYNSSNLNSNFYQNVVINFEEKQIDCDFFDIDMQTNTAIAYGNVIVTDPKSIMRAGEITLDIQTKDINIEPGVKKKINIKTE